MEKENAEIEKLTERIAKDPKSKLFVPLAEEHKKAGDIETAILVLTEGLKNNPGYVTARSFLGRLLMDKGDLAGAQKELEEVIKTIPDNLLAQRKLGDIYALQGRVADALPRYKAALALNPGDKDLPSLIAGLEAKAKIERSAPIPVSKPVSSAEMRPQPGPAATVLPKTLPGAVSGTAGPSQTVSAVQKTSAAPGPQAATKEERAAMAPGPPVAAELSSLSVPDEAEVIEDIVELESLDQAIPGPLTGLSSSESVPAPESFDLSEPLIEKTSVGEEDTVVSWDVTDAAVPEQIEPAGTDEGSDDLNTNTLAELYISQGFYDKAIEIYQGMLNDRPGNTVLQQKLENIRTMAGVADKGHEQFTKKPSGPGEYAPPAQDVFTAEPDNTIAAPVIPSPAKDVLPQKEVMPRERAPQMNVREPSAEPAAPRGPQTATTRRKETIDRLESWLNTIKKEKQE